jgi:hypothetical protein
MAKLMGERMHLATVCEGDRGIRTDLPLVYMEGNTNKKIVWTGYVKSK